MLTGQEQLKKEEIKEGQHVSGIRNKISRDEIGKLWKERAEASGSLIWTVA